MKVKKHQKIAIVMGSQSDYSTMKDCVKIFKILKISFDLKIVSAHRTPKRLYEFAKKSESSYSVIIAGAGGSAHLPGMIASLTTVPVIGVPVESKKLKGLDSLLSIVQMPKGIPVGTVAIGKDGAINAALYAASILGIADKKVKNSLLKLRIKQSKSVKKKTKIINEKNLPRYFGWWSIRQYALYGCKKVKYLYYSME